MLRPYHEAHQQDLSCEQGSVMKLRSRNFLLAILAISAFFPAFADARGGRHSNGPYYGGGHHTTSHGGHYVGGNGSSHKGGHYKNPRTGDHYGHHTPG